MQKFRDLKMETTENGTKDGRFVEILTSGILAIFWIYNFFPFFDNLRHTPALEQIC